MAGLNIMSSIPMVNSFMFRWWLRVLPVVLGASGSTSVVAPLAQRQQAAASTLYQPCVSNEHPSLIDARLRAADRPHHRRRQLHELSGPDVHEQGFPPGTPCRAAGQGLVALFVFRAAFVSLRVFGSSSYELPTFTGDALYSALFKYVQ